MTPFPMMSYSKAIPCQNTTSILQSRSHLSPSHHPLYPLAPSPLLFFDNSPKDRLLLRALNSRNKWQAVLGVELDADLPAQGSRSAV